MQAVSLAVVEYRMSTAAFAGTETATGTDGRTDGRTDRKTDGQATRLDKQTNRQ